ncbi:hypothetical protein PCH_Pc21g21360 [Penicillium rubens Wisconsin 54-1255]|uniref:Uncharacterized protein n=1 Tax=Penicillium rubens (strain ATCC 28089 / DSM 1075 / NRRL 1951 / Wisconsin 54-1255) TaxID=500485 RepID=B6HLT8_PENRW|nr:hypothetical protein PCH_Pc21g21360 [Penicillium rubens Wisconsin 54-1255]
MGLHNPALTLFVEDLPAGLCPGPSQPALSFQLGRRTCPTQACKVIRLNRRLGDAANSDCSLRGPNPLGSTGLSLLSLDSSGVRGLSTLSILKELILKVGARHLYESDGTNGRQCGRRSEDGVG